jgi:predicted thioesterase
VSVSLGATPPGQAVEVDNPLKTFVGKRGTFTWRAQIFFLDAGLPRG